MKKKKKEEKREKNKIKCNERKNLWRQVIE